MHPADLRAQFPVLERIAYLNAGTDGPVPAAGVAAAREALDAQAQEGRSRAHFEARKQEGVRRREAYAELLRCAPEDVALTTSTTEGCGIVVDGLELGRGDEVVTSDEEHPGLLGALQAARDLRGVTVTQAPFARIHEAVGPRTRLVATSHVSWVGGAVAPAELAEVDVPVLLDGAQGIGAVPVDVAALGADAYAAAGQKWLCGPDGSGMLFVSPALRERLAVRRRGFLSFEDVGLGIESPLKASAERYEATSLPREGGAFALAALGVLRAFGWERLHERARELAARLAGELRDRGHEVAPRSDTTLVSWRVDEARAEAERDRLAAEGILLRNLPGRGLLRASVGAWNDESDLERLLAAL